MSEFAQTTSISRPRIDPKVLLAPSDFYEASEQKSYRQMAKPWQLLKDAMGHPRVWRRKGYNLAYALWLSGNTSEFKNRLKRLQAKGLIDEIPTRLQIFFGSLDMLRYYLAPGAKDYYASRGINYTFHNFLKILDDPASLIDPSGIRSPRDTIIGHVLHVVHANPIYDFQLLEMYEDGMDEMEKQTQWMVDGIHPRQQTINAIVEDPEYHSRLLRYIKTYRKDPFAPMLHRRAGMARQNRTFILCEATFGTLDSSFRYFSRLPKSLRELIQHYRENPTLNAKYCDPEIVTAMH